jgi:hypothetical protein
MKFRFKESRLSKTASFRGILSSIISDFNLDESYLIESVRSEWPDIAGELISTHSIPDRIFKGVLFVLADHPVYANEITMMKTVFLEKLRGRYSGDVIRNIKVEIKKIDWKNARARAHK